MLKMESSMTLITEEIENLDRYQAFIVFEPASVRISDQDIFVIGKDVRKVFDKTFDFVIEREDDMKMKILYHQMQKLSNMLDLIDDFDNIIITKFFDRIWRRYSYVTHLGESFISLKGFLDLFPEYNDKYSDLIANRIDAGAIEFDEDEDNDNDEEDTTDDQAVKVTDKPDEDAEKDGSED